MNAKRLFTFVLILNLALSLAPVSHPVNTALAAAPAPEADVPVVEGTASQAGSLPEGVSQDWWAQAQEYIQGSEYEISWQEPTYLPDLPGAYQAPNRAQGLRIYFTPQGIRVIARTEITPTWQLGISLAGFGDPADIQMVSEAALSPTGNRMDYQRQGLAEWYLNTEEGLEQGFILNAGAGERTGNASEPAQTTLDLAIQTDLTPVLALDGIGVEFTAPDGRQLLRYGDLQALDAAGQVVPVEMSLLSADVPGGAVLRLTLPSLAGPLTLTARLTSLLVDEVLPDSLTATYDWTAKGAQHMAQLGNAVGTAGDVNGDGYDDIIVGAWAYDNGNIDEGIVFVWYGGADGLGPSQRLPDWSAEGEQNNFGFGYAVGTAGDVNGDGFDDILVSTPYSGTTDVGGAFVWYGSTTGLGASGTPANADWQAEGILTNDWFGAASGTAGDVNSDGYDDIIAGAIGYDHGTTDEGGVFVWYGSNTGLCMGSMPCKVSLTDADWWSDSNLASAYLGYSVGTAGDVNGDGASDIVVGAYGFDGHRGKAYVWYGSQGVGLGDDQRPSDWSKDGANVGEQFGVSAGTAGDVNGDGYSDILIGANGGSANWYGKVYVFYGGVGGIQETPWSFESFQANTALGQSVSTAGDVNGDGYDDILVGAPYYEWGETDEGAAFLWYGSAQGMGISQRPPDWKREINTPYDHFGWSVSTAGDVNGDGYSDFIVGAPGTDSAYPNQPWDVGQVYVYYGASGNPPIYAGTVKPGLQVSELTGYSVDTAGDVNGDGYSDIIVGAPYYDEGAVDRGKVFVWYGSPDGLCPPDQGGCPPDWEAVGEHASDLFGFSVGTAGDVNGDGYSDIIIGSRLYESEGGHLNEGAAYVWYGSAAGLGAGYAWRAESHRYGTDMGWSVGTAGDVNGDGYDDIIVGAPYYNESGDNNEGAVFVWKGGANGLCAGVTPCTVGLETVAWWYRGEQAQALLGSSVGTAGDINGDGCSDIIVGAHQFGGANYFGKVYVWYGSNPGGLGLSLRDPDWKYEGTSYGGRVGYSVGAAGDVNGDGYSDIIFGAVGLGLSWGGTVFVFYGGASGMQADYWRYQVNRINTQLGFSVGSAGDVNGDGYADILVGAPDFDGGQYDEGAVYIWYGSVGGMGKTQREPDWVYESDQAAAKFGYSVSTAGDVNGDGYSDILVGAPLFDTPGYADAGSVFVFYGTRGGLRAGDHDTFEGDQGTARLGFSVASAGDVNGDGYSDVIVGAPFYDNDQASEGRIYVYLGSPTGILTNTFWIAEGDRDNADLGSAVGSAGDVNGDGYDDIITGAPGYNNGQVEEGAAFVWYGSKYGLGSYGDPDTANWKAEGDQALAFFGIAVGSAGDVNGDGYSDVIVGADGYDHGQMNEGQARVYYGSAAGLSLTPNWTAESDQTGAAFGRSVGSAGDVNGDGYSDVIVGAWKYTNGEMNEGRAYVYYGARTGLSSSPSWTAESNQVQAYFGFAVGTAGDVNGDGYSDVIIGAYQYQQGNTWRDVEEGAAFVWYGSEAGLGSNGDPANAGWMAEGDQEYAQFGYAVGTAGDVNGDGFSDVLVGAPAYNNGPLFEGRVLVYYGSSLGLSVNERWTAEGDQEGASLGFCVASAGDITGDGFADVIVGVPTYDNDADIPVVTDVGLARVYHGNSQGALSPSPRQMKTGAALPIALLGRSDSQTAVELRLTGRMPLGRERVKLEWQVAPLGMPFTATTVITGTSTAWTDTGLSGAVIAQQVTGLTPGTPYHWRVRLIYSGNSLGLSASRWFSLSGNGWQELDFRTASPPTEFLKMYLPVVVK